MLIFISRFINLIPIDLAMFLKQHIIAFGVEIITIFNKAVTNKKRVQVIEF